MASRKVDNFKCELEYKLDSKYICNSTIKHECRGTLCRHYGDCYWCKVKDSKACNNCKNRK